MKTLYIEARKKLFDINFKELDKLHGKTISLASTIQYIGFIPQISDYLKSKGRKVIIKQGAKHPAHVLGCNSNAFDKNADVLLLLADGKFHALNNAVSLNREIYIFNSRTLEKIEKSEIEKIKARIKAKQKKFLLHNNIGIIVSTKLGQKYPYVFKLKEKLEKLGKKVYVFETDNINTSELENFKIPIWINTACPGLGTESPSIINLKDIQEFI